MTRIIPHAAERRAREQHLAAIERVAQLGSWEWDVGSDRVTWSDELFRIYGLEPGSVECTFESYLARVHPDDRERVSGIIAHALAEEEVFAFEERIVRPSGEVRVLASNGRVVRDSDGKPLRLLGGCQDVTQRVDAAAREQALEYERHLRRAAEEQEKRAAFMAEAATLLASSLDYEETLSRLAALAVPVLADWCAIDVLESDGSTKRVVVAHPDPEKAELARELHRRYPPDPNATTGVPEVLRTGRPELIEVIPPELIDAIPDPEQRRIIKELRLTSAIVVPLRAGGRVHGAMSLVSAESGEHYDEQDLRFAMDLASRAAFAIENARLYQGAQAAREELERRSDQFRFLANSIPVQVWTAGPDGQLDYVNEQVVSYFGDPAERIMGEGWVDKLPPDQAPAVIDAWTRAVTTGEPYEVEFLLRRHDGEFRWHLARARAQRDPAGRIIRWFGSNTDIHEAKLAEADRERMTQEREAERGRLLEIFEQAPAFICTLSGPEHVFRSANPLYLQLVGRNDIIGKSVAEALPEVVDQGYVSLLDRVYTSGEPYIGTEVPIQLRRDPDAPEEQVFVNFLYQPMRDAAGQVYGIFVHGMDVTDHVRQRNEIEAKADELSRIARQLRISNQELDQFAYVASHDLKAPLRGIANLSQWIEEDLEGQATPEVREHLDKLRGRIMRMEGLIDGILQFSRAGRVREDPERIDVGALVEEVVELIAPRKEVKVVVESPLPELTTEKLPLQQVFMNLIGNAVKFAPSDGSGWVRVGYGEENGRWLRFFVRDNGPGIPEEYHERVFGIFQTLQPRDEVEGTGIGLSLVKKIVETRGGRVWVESREGEGANFSFLWPKD